jgi:hypothetical protein
MICGIMQYMIEFEHIFVISRGSLNIELCFP